MEANEAAQRMYLQNMPKLLISMRGALAVSDYALFIRINSQIKTLAQQIEFHDLVLICERFEEGLDHCPAGRYSAHVRDCVTQFYSSVSKMKEIENG